MQLVKLVLVLYSASGHAAAPASTARFSGMMGTIQYMSDLLVTKIDQHESDLSVTKIEEEVPEAVRRKFNDLTLPALPNKSDLKATKAEVLLEIVQEPKADISNLELFVSPLAAFSLLAGVAAGVIAKRWLSMRTGKPMRATGGRLGRWLPWCHTMLCMYAQLFQFTMTVRCGLPGILLAGLYQFIVCVVLDFIISDAPWENLRSLKRNGFEDWQAPLSLVTCQIVWSSNAFWAWYFVPDFEMSFSPQALLSVILSLALAELVFTGIHILMHKYEFLDDWVHKFHHCCLTPSMSSNYLFSVVDGLVESHGPWFCAWSVYKFIVKDPWGLWLSLYVIQQWYLLDHDENIQTHHYRHHKYIDAEYNAYTPIKLKGIKDELRLKVKRSDK